MKKNKKVNSTKKQSTTGELKVASIVSYIFLTLLIIGFLSTLVFYLKIKSDQPYNNVDKIEVESYEVVSEIQTIDSACSDNNNNNKIITVNAFPANFSCDLKEGECDVDLREVDFHSSDKISSVFKISNEGNSMYNNTDQKGSEYFSIYDKDNQLLSLEHDEYGAFTGVLSKTKSSYKNCVLTVSSVEKSVVKQPSPKNAAEKGFCKSSNEGEYVYLNGKFSLPMFIYMLGSTVRIDFEYTGGDIDVKMNLDKNKTKPNTMNELPSNFTYYNLVVRDYNGKKINSSKSVRIEGSYKHSEAKDGKDSCYIAVSRISQ